MNQEVHCRMRADARRDLIMREAIRLFAQKGFKGTTTRELSAAVGVSEPILYEHFRGKHELYEAILNRMSAEAFENLAALIDAQTDAADDRAFVLGISHGIAEWFLKEPAFVRLVLFSSLEGDELGRAFHQKIHETLTDGIRQYFEIRKTFRAVDPEILAHMLVCTMAHHGLLQVLFPNQTSRSHDEVVESMVDMLMSGIYK